MFRLSAGAGGSDLRRRMWPDNNNRYCTSDIKRGPGNRIITILGKRFRGWGRAKIIQVFGFRAEESPRRRKMPDFWIEKRLTNGKKLVWSWLPIHNWTETEVWADIKASGIAHHYAYDLGMPRLSCRFCIFAPPGALKIAAQQFPELYEEYKKAEAEIGHTFRHHFSIAEVEHFVQVGPLKGDWNM